MKIEAREHSLVITEAFSGVLFVSDDKEEFGICMRDSGFEFSYNGRWYEAKNGILKEMVASLYPIENDVNSQGAPR